MKILVLGSNGQVGRELQSVLPYWKFGGAQRPQLTFCTRSELDLTDTPSILRYLERVAPSVVVNAAAYTAVDMAESQERLAFLVNEEAVRQVALYCSVNRCTLIHISTDYVFDGLGNGPYSECDTVAPSGIYGKSKLAGERVISEVLDKHIILRTSWVFGASGGNFVKTMLRLAAEKRELRVVADQYGAPTSARGVAESVAEIIRQCSSDAYTDADWGIYHYSGFPFVSWAEFAKEIFAQALDLGLIDGVPKVNPILSSEYPTPAARPANSRLDCAKFQSAFGIKPDDWKNSLGSMLEELKIGMQN